MATWTYEISSTGDYSSPGAAIADYNNASHSDGDTVEWEIVDEGPYTHSGYGITFTAFTNINWIMRAKSGSEWNGSTGSGAEVAINIESPSFSFNTINGSFVCEDFEVNHNGQNTGGSGGGCCVHSDPNSPVIFRRMAVYDYQDANRNTYGIRFRYGGGGTQIVRTAVYNATSVQAGDSIFGITMGTSGPNVGVCVNCICDNLHHPTTGLGNVTGIGSDFNDLAGTVINNCISTRTSTDGTGTAADFDSAVQSPTNADVDYNASEDSTATGGNSITGVSAASIYVSVTVGSEDYTLASAAVDGVDDGIDLGTSYSANISVGGFDNNAVTTYDPWDMGIQEFQSGGGGGSGSSWYNTLQEQLAA